MSKYPHPIGKFIDIPEWADAEEKKLMQDYNRLMWRPTDIKTDVAAYDNFRARKIYYMADHIRAEYAEAGVVFETNKTGKTNWRLVA